MISFSFDTDHMNEARMREFLETCRFPGRGTYFCTQPYECLDKIDCELAPHPYLGKQRDWIAELNGKRAEFPAAVGWRSHSCVFSHIIAEWLAFNGYVYASTFECFGMDRIAPIRNQWGIWQMPIFYMDNLDFSRGRFWPTLNEKPFSRELIEIAVGGDGYYVFDFHPIHLLLNTPDPETYSRLRNRFLGGEDVAKLRHPGRGAFTFYCELIEAMERKSIRSHSIMESLRHFAPDACPLDLSKIDYRFEEHRLNF